MAPDNHTVVVDTQVAGTGDLCTEPTAPVFCSGSPKKMDFGRGARLGSGPKQQKQGDNILV